MQRLLPFFLAFRAFGSGAAARAFALQSGNRSGDAGCGSGARFRHAHHVFGHTVGFLLVLIAGSVDLQLSLQAAGDAVISHNGLNLMHAVDRAVIQPGLHPSEHRLVSQGRLQLHKRMEWNGRGGGLSFIRRVCSLSGAIRFLRRLPCAIHFPDACRKQLDYSLLPLRKSTWMTVPPPAPPDVADAPPDLTRLSTVVVFAKSISFTVTMPSGVISVHFTFLMKGRSSTMRVTSVTLTSISTPCFRKA